MSYWRMQLHPNEPEFAAYYTVQSLARGFIGLDFAEDPGDLERLDVSELEANPNNIRGFVTEIQRDDYILISLHHQPFALATDIGSYNYIKNHVAELDIWFRHFRQAGTISYYSDVFGRIREEESHLVMTNTFAGVSLDTVSGRLIAEWISRI